MHVSLMLIFCFVFLLFFFSLSFFLLLITFSYSFDVRGRPFEKALYWSDSNSFGPRAYFVTNKQPAKLTVDNIQLDDEGVSLSPIVYRVYTCIKYLFVFLFFFLCFHTSITGVQMSC